VRFITVWLHYIPMSAYENPKEIDFHYLCWVWYA